jgi:hypothetical protein
MSKRSAPAAANTPLKSSEPQDFGFDPRDDLLTIQGKVPAETTTRRKMEADVLEHFSDVSVRPASEQAKFFLNAFWYELAPGQAERIYNEWKIFKIVQKEASSSDRNIVEDGPSVTAPLARVFLQRLKRTMTAEDFTNQFKEIDTNYDGQMSYIEYLVWDSQKTPASVIYRPQVTSAAFLKKIQAVLKAQKALRDHEDELRRLEEGSQQEGLKGKRFASELAQYKNATSTAGLNADLASAHEGVLKTRHSLKFEGNDFWAATLDAEAKSNLSQKQQHKR